jgi:hypothetical protein
MLDPTDAAYALAARLDGMLDHDEGDELDDALYRIGELIGGLSVGGFRRDLDAHLARDDAEDDAAGIWVREATAILGRSMVRA